MPKAFLTTILCVFSITACASPPDDGAVHLRGTIDSRMVAEARAAVSRGVRDFTIESPGGYTLQAYFLGKALKGTRLTAVRDCSSACVVALMAVDDRHAAPGTILRLHDATGAPDASATGAALMASYGVPADLVELTQRRGVVNLRPADLDRMGIAQ